MFFVICVKVCGLDFKSYYMFMMDVVLLDNKCYRWEIVYVGREGEGWNGRVIKFFF